MLQNDKYLENSRINLDAIGYANKTVFIIISFQIVSNHYKIKIKNFIFQKYNFAY